MGKEVHMQNEMSYRAGDSLGFVDELAVKELIVQILGSSRGFLYPEVLTGQEMSAIRRHLRRHHASLNERVRFVPGVRMETGAGTLVEIDKKRRRGK